MNNMNAPTIKSTVTPENHGSGIAPLNPKMPLPQNSLIPQTNHTAFSHSSVVSTTNEISVQPNADKPLNLYVTPVQKNTTNGVPGPGSSNLETLKPVHLPASIPPTFSVTNLTTKEEKVMNETEVTSSSGLTNPKSVEQRFPSPALTTESSLETELPKSNEKEPIKEKIQQKNTEKHMDNTDKKEIVINEQPASASEDTHLQKPENLNVQQSDIESENVPQPVKKRKHAQVRNINVQEDTSTENDSVKAKRARLPTQVYQSPLPELQLIAKLTSPLPKTTKPASGKLITFYKNEFLAVRNPEGSFYICQTFQNIHRKSTKIKIRWFTDLPNDVYQPDFCDTTEFDCILTNVNLIRLEKDKWKLPENERTRIVNILKRALDVEKGVAKPSVTEEHPDGLDLSLYKDEAQLNRKKPVADYAKKNVNKRQNQSTAQASSSGVVTPSKKSFHTSYLNQSFKSSVNTAISPSTTTKSKSIAVVASSSSKRRGRKPAKIKKSNLKNKKPTKRESGAKATKVDTNNYGSDRKTLKVTITTKEKNDKKVTKNSNATAASKTTKSTVSTIAVSSSSAGTTSTTSSSATSSGVKQVALKGILKKTSTIVSSSTVADKPAKIRNAGSAVSAKINSASTQPGKNNRERKSSAAATTTTSQKKT